MFIAFVLWFLGKSELKHACVRVVVDRPIGRVDHPDFAKYPRKCFFLFVKVAFARSFEDATLKAARTIRW
jgi:hypothetical protein